MELHRNTTKSRRIGLLAMMCGLLTLTLPTFLAVLGREFLLGPWLWYLIAAVLIAIGGYALYSSSKPFRLALDDMGLTVRVEGLHATVSWDAIEEVTVERLSYERPPGAPHLVVWPAAHANLTVRPNYTRNGRSGFSIIPMDEFVEAPDLAIAALRRYAGRKFQLIHLPD